MHCGTQGSPATGSLPEPRECPHWRPSVPLMHERSSPATFAPLACVALRLVCLRCRALPGHQSFANLRKTTAPPSTAILASAIANSVAPRESPALSMIIPVTTGISPAGI